jgi:hypothetical protein
MELCEEQPVCIYGIRCMYYHTASSFSGFLLDVIYFMAGLFFHSENTMTVWFGNNADPDGVQFV